MDYPPHDRLVHPCAGYTGHPFKKSEGAVPKLSASPLVLLSQRNVYALKLRAGKPLLNEQASSYLDNQLGGCVFFVSGKKTRQRIHNKQAISLRRLSSYVMSSSLHFRLVYTASPVYAALGSSRCNPPNTGMAMSWFT
jgi:hypothetical protein